MVIRMHSIPALLILAIAALLTSALSAIIGMGGGILLLAVMFSFMSYGEAIPAHAAVQIASNGTRVLAYLREVEWRTIRRFCIGALPGSVAGTLLLWRLGKLDDAEPYLKTLVGVYVLAATYVPRPKAAAAQERWWDFPLIGFIGGVAALMLGAIGPLIAPMFPRRGILKERLIATKAVCQLILHVTKIPAFLALGLFEAPKLGVTAAVLIAAAVPGTLLGKKVLARHVSEARFVLLYRAALTISGVKILIWDGLRLILI